MFLLTSEGSESIISGDCNRTKCVCGQKAVYVRVVCATVNIRLLGRKYINKPAS